MKFKDFLISFIGVIMIGALVMYYFVPLEQITFGTSTNSEFNIENKSNNMQFYPDMRFPYKEISYKISDKCPLSKTLEMEEAFDIIENLTDLNFYPDEKEPQINIFCEEKNRMEEGLFIAGEGGPTKILELDKYSLILSGEILLIRTSSCSKPNIATHELLHVLGFDHSENPNNIMYSISKCKQTMGNEIPSEINRIYSGKSLPDLKLEEITAEQEGRYLNFNISINNQGLVNSSKSNLKIYGDEKVIYESEINELSPGSGIKLTIKTGTNQIKIEKIKIKVESPDLELSKKNNEILLEKI